MSPWLTALLICLLAVIAEAVLAGNHVREHLRQIKLPRASPPIWLWIGIGLAYYIICYTILFRLLAHGGDRKRDVAVVLMVLILAANAFWNYLFFRAKNFLACLVFSVGYGRCCRDTPAAARNGRPAIGVCSTSLRRIPRLCGPVAAFDLAS